MEGIKNNFIPLIVFVVAIWVVEAVNFILGHGLTAWGILPRQASGLIGIPLAPFLHGGLWHAASNTLPLLILGSLMLIGGRARFWAVTTGIVLLGGFLVWLFARNALHVGASGLVFGYFGALLARAYIERSLLAIAIAGAFITAFYMARLVYLTFFGKYKGAGHPHESPNGMTYPMIGLAVGAVLFGFLNVPGGGWFTEAVGARFVLPGDHHSSFSFVLAGVGLLVAFAGIGAGYKLWRQDAVTQEGRDTFRIPVLYPLLEHKYYIDDLYMDGVIRPIRGPIARGIDWFNGHVIDFVVNGAGYLARGLGRVVYAFDQRGIDGAINASGAAAGLAGGVLRLFQTGRVQQYAIMIFAGTLLLVVGLIIF